MRDPDERRESSFLCASPSHSLFVAFLFFWVFVTPAETCLFRPVVSLDPPTGPSHCTDPPTSASGKLNIGAEGSRTWCKRGDFTACAAHVVIVTSHTSTVSRSCSLVNWISSEPHGAPGVFVIVERWRRCSERQFIGCLWFQYWVIMQQRSSQRRGCSYFLATPERHLVTFSSCAPHTDVTISDKNKR